MIETHAPLLLALFEPDIAQNAGAMIRTCACLGVEAAIIEPAGFRFADKRFRRAGNGLSRRRDDSEPRVLGEIRRLARFRPASSRPPDDERRRQSMGICLPRRRHSSGRKKIGGCSRRGQRVRRRSPADSHSLALRSLNVSVAATIAMTEALRQIVRLPSDKPCERETASNPGRGGDNAARLYDCSQGRSKAATPGKKMNEDEAVRVLIADDHPLMVGGLRQAVLAAAPGAEISIAHDFDSMVAALSPRQTPI